MNRKMWEIEERMDDFLQKAIERKVRENIDYVNSQVETLSWSGLSDEALLAMFESCKFEMKKRGL